jgi:tetratricopeptide (TPR) repeat protein
MSPEQVLSDRVDERTDIYTLGVILFELVTGRRPYKDVFDLLSGDDGTAPIRTAHDVDGTIAPHVSASIARAMARRPADRFQTARELEQELRRLLLEEATAGTTQTERTARPAFGHRRSIAWYAGWSLAAAIAVGATAFVYSNRSITSDVTSAAARTGKPVIAVLPLDNLTGDALKDYLGIGIADSMTTSLAHLSSISVVSRSNMRDAGAATRPVSEVARNLGVTMLVGGSIQQVGELLRVNATLTRVNDGQVLWSGDEDGRHEQLFSMQNRLAEALVNALRIRITADERQDLARAPTEDVEARDAYWMGLALLDRPDDPDFGTAVDHFKRATTRDRGFSLAFAALGEAYRRRSVRTNDAALMEEAKIAVTEALRLDPDQPEVRLSLAGVLRSTGFPGSAVDEIRRVLTDQPDNDNAHRLLGVMLAREGRSQEALSALQKAADLRPNYWPNQEQLGLFFYANGRLQDAIDAFRRVAALKPDDALPFSQLGAMYLLQGDVGRARENFEKSNQVQPTAGSFANLGMIAFYEGRFDAAVREYEAAVGLEPTIAVHRGNVGDAYRKVGRTADARAAYLKAIELGEQALTINPNDATTESRLGVYYAKVGSLTQAALYATRAARTSPTDPDVLYLRAVVLVLTGQRDAAMRQLSEAINRGYAVHLALKDDDLAPLRSLPAFQRLAAATPR